MAKPHILVMAGDDAIEALTAAGFVIAGKDKVRRQTAAIVVDTRGEQATKAGELVRSLRAALGPRAGLFLAWHDGQDAPDLSDFDGILDCHASPAALSTRLGSSLRIAVMADEARLRFKTLAQFGGPAQPPVINTDRTPRILLYGAPGGDFLRLTGILNALGADVIGSYTSFTAFDYLHDGAFDGVAVLAQDDRGSALSFCAALRRNAKLYHLPCMIFASPDFRDPDEAIARGATDFAIAGDHDEAAAERLLDHVDEKRSRDALNLAFSAARTRAAMDRSTGLYTAAFFDAHVQALATRAHETDRPLAVVVARVLPDPMLSHMVQTAGIERIVSQAGAMLSRLVRAEDVAARMDATTFAVAFPASDEDAALIVGERIAAVLECTGFDVGADEAGFSNDQAAQIVVQTASAGLKRDERASDLLARAFARLPAHNTEGW